VLTLVSGGFCVQCTWLDDVFVVDRFVLFTAVWLLGAVVFFVNPSTGSPILSHRREVGVILTPRILWRILWFVFLLKGFRAEP